MSASDPISGCVSTRDEMCFHRVEDSVTGLQPGSLQTVVKGTFDTGKKH